MKRDDAFAALVKSLALPDGYKAAQKRRVAAGRRERAITDLRCRTRGCRESLATIALSIGDHEDAGGPGPILHVNVQAAFVHAESTDPSVAHGTRIRLASATSPDHDGGKVMSFSSWKRGSKIEFECRHGHVSQFGAGEPSASRPCPAPS